MSTNPANELVLCIPRIARANWCIEDACTIKDEFVKEFGQCVVRVKVSRSRKWPDCAKVSVVLLVNSQRVKDLELHYHWVDALVARTTLALLFGAACADANKRRHPRSSGLHASRHCSAERGLSASLELKCRRVSFSVCCMRAVFFS